MYKTSIFILFLLLTSFLMRVTTHTYPFGSDDSNRDYLVAHHIVAYHEYPLTGPFVAVTKSRNSPSYYYFLAAFMFIKDDPIFLRIINVILQVITIFIIFKLAERLFGRKTAMLTAVIFSFNNYSLIQSAFVWQPWVMQPFINLSYLLLVLAYQKKRYYLTLLSAFIFIFSCSIHMSAIAFGPVFFILLLTILISQKLKTKHYVALFGTIIFSLLLFFGPIFMAFMKNSHIFTPAANSNLSGIYGSSQIVINLIKNIPYFVGGSLFYISSISIWTILLSITVCSLLVYYFYRAPKQEKKYSWPLLCSIILSLILLSIVNIKIINTKYGIHYFTPVYGLFIILLSRAMIFTFEKNNFLRVLGTLLLSIYFGFFLTFIYKMSYQNKTDFSLKYLQDPAINAIKSDVVLIKNTNNYSDFNFFKIESKGSDELLGWKYNSTVWAIMERELNVKLVQIDDFNHDGFVQINNKKAKYLFLICPEFHTPRTLTTHCISDFLIMHKNYLYNKKTYSNSMYRIDLFEKRN